MKTRLKEGLPAMVPEYPVQVAGHHLTLRFDVNINKTKKGVKLQFVMRDAPEDPKELQTMANEIGTELQERFGAANMQIIYDVENPYRNVIGFLLPLPSLANNIVKNVLKGSTSAGGTEVEDEEEVEELPAKEIPPGDIEEPIKEWLMRMAGMKK